MDNEPRRQGRLVAFLNADKQPGDQRPAFNGEISLPEDPIERHLVLWAHATKKGHTLLAGRVSKSAMEQIEALTRPSPERAEDLIEQAQTDGKQLAVDINEILMFENTRKTPEQAKAPDYWGYFNPGNGEPLMRVTAWAKTDSHGKAMLSGAVDVHEPAHELKKQRERLRSRGR
jgi:hypothetical protein